MESVIITGFYFKIIERFLSYMSLFKPNLNNLLQKYKEMEKIISVLEKIIAENGF